MNLWMLALGVVLKAMKVIPNSPWPTLFISFGLLYVFYVLLTFASNWQVRSPLMLLYPPYALWQAVGMPTAGLVWYVVYARRNRSFGRYRFGYRRGIPNV